jgi:hypothetical protein
MGQITLETAFGQELRALGANPKYRVFVEIGSWDGQGSTKCLWDGMSTRSDGPRLVSLEANKNWWRVAANAWKDVSGGPTILWGRLAERMMTDKEVLEHPLYEEIRDHYALHYTQDERDFATAPLVRMRRCDVAVLDGGEFCGMADWAAIEPLAPRIVCLDDTRVMKNAEVLKKLLDAGWKMFWSSDERNGAAILERPEQEVLDKVLLDRFDAATGMNP